MLNSQNSPEFVELNREEVNNNREKWLKFLRSNGINKAKGHLETPKSYGVKNSRCCLGHACHILGFKARHGVRSNNDDVVRYNSANLTLPRAAREMLNITKEGKFLIPVEVKGKKCTHSYISMAHLNDNTSLTLKEIADIIEEQLKAGNVIEPYLYHLEGDQP